MDIIQKLRSKITDTIANPEEEVEVENDENLYELEVEINGLEDFTQQKFNAWAQLESSEGEELLNLKLTELTSERNENESGTKEEENLTGNVSHREGMESLQKHYYMLSNNRY